MRERLVKMAGYFGDLFGTSVRKAERDYARLPAHKERIAKDLAEARDAFQEARYAVFDRVDSAPEQKALYEKTQAKVRRVNDAFDDRRAQIASSKGTEAASAYVERNLHKAHEAREKFRKQRVQAEAAQYAAAQNADPDFVKARQNLSFVTLAEKGLQRSEKELPGRITELAKARTLTRGVTGGVLAAGLAGGAALHARSLAKRQAWQRNLGIGAAGAAGLGGLAAYKKSKD
jgi:hypothetical protein